MKQFNFVVTLRGKYYLCYFSLLINIFNMLVFFKWAAPSVRSTREYLACVFFPKLSVLHYVLQARRWTRRRQLAHHLVSESVSYL